MRRVCVRKHDAYIPHANKTWINRKQQKKKL